MKIRVSNGAGQVAEFEVPEENLWLDVIDSRGEVNRPGFRSYRFPCSAVAGEADSRSA